MESILKKILFNYIHRHWNIAIATLGDDMSPKGAKWMQHNYKDRWFADPFIIDETEDAFIILAEEYMRELGRARLARLTVDKADCKLLINETVLELDTHLSFPNFFIEGDKIYIYPENGRAGHTKYYEYGLPLKVVGELSPLPLADAVMQRIGDLYYLLYTLGEECNSNILKIDVSKSPFGPYAHHQEITFSDNVARRAGRIFQHNGKLISPAQICNNTYGEGVCLQEFTIDGDKIELKEIKRIYPTGSEQNEGLHTFNTYGQFVVIDGFRFKYPMLSKIYSRLRGGQL